MTVDFCLSVAFKHCSVAKSIQLFNPLTTKAPGATAKQSSRHRASEIGILGFFNLHFVSVPYKLRAK